jgi:hypothetical protein
MFFVAVMRPLTATHFVDNHPSFLACEDCQFLSSCAHKRAPIVRIVIKVNVSEDQVIVLDADQENDLFRGCQRHHELPSLESTCPRMGDFETKMRVTSDECE